MAGFIRRRALAVLAAVVLVGAVLGAVVAASMASSAPDGTAGESSNCTAATGAYAHHNNGLPTQSRPCLATARGAGRHP